jgi:hypothetical protein
MSSVSSGGGGTMAHWMRLDSLEAAPTFEAFEMFEALA